jgi:hypothetical protein
VLVFVFFFPSSFRNIELGPAQLAPALLDDPNSSNGLPDGYISELLSRFDDDGIDMVKQY